MLQLLLVSDPKIFRDLMIARGSDFSERAETAVQNCYSKKGQSISFSQPNKTWKTLRKLGHASLKIYDKGLDRIETISMEMLNDMFDTFANQNGEPFDPMTQLTFATMNIASILITGKNYSIDSDIFKNFRKLQIATFDLLSRRTQGAIMDAFPWLSHFYDLLAEPGQRFHKAAADLFNLVEIESRKAEEEGFDLSYGSILLKAVERSEITSLNAQLATADILLGGASTTSNTMYAYINILIHHPKIQKKLQDEIDEVVGNRQVVLDDREKLPYHQAALLEILRYTSAAPFGIPHRANKDTTINGKFVPGKTRIFFLHYALQHDEDLFPEPFSFKPERFLDDQGNIVPADHPNRRNLFIFGAGPRVCFGEPLAKSRLFLFLASLSQRFDVRGDETKDLVPYDARNYTYMGLLFPPQYRVRMIERNK